MMKKRFSFLLFVLSIQLSLFATDTNTLPGLILHLNRHVETIDKQLETDSGPDLIHEEEELETYWSKGSEILSDCVEDTERFHAAHQDCQLGYILEGEGDLAGARDLLFRSYEAVREIWEKREGLETESDEEFCIQDPLFSDNVYLDTVKKARKKGISGYKAFKKNPYISKKEKKAASPYILPDKHPLWPILNSIFQKQRVTLNPQTFQEAGFIPLVSQRSRLIIVARHPMLPGYLVKVYLDSEHRTKKGVVGWKWLVRRAEGVAKVQKAIKNAKSKYFTAPKKWIYPLPQEPSPPNDPAYQRKSFILVVEDMQLVPWNDNLNAWKSVNKSVLNEFYRIIIAANGSSYRADNVPYTKSGKFAFIDTEYPHLSPQLSAIRPFLSPEMQTYWDKITN